MSKKNLVFKPYHLTMEVNGITVKATIYYTSKDYYIEISEPIHHRLPGAHLMYMIPAYYVIEKEPNDKPGLSQVPILDRCKNEIANAVSEHEKGL